LLSKFRNSTQLFGLALAVTLLTFRVWSFNLILVISALLISFYAGRIFCGWLCPMGTWLEHAVSKISRKKEIPSLITSKFSRFTFLFLFLTGLTLAFYKFPTMYVSFGVIGFMMLSATGMGIIYSPKSWCAYTCPWGTMMSLGGKFQKFRHQRKDCINCCSCLKSCPKPEMLDAFLKNNDISEDGLVIPDCIKCMSCMEKCTKKAISIQ